MDYVPSETLSPIYGLDSTDSMFTVVPETPMVEVPPWTDSQPSMFFETPDLEAILDSELIVPDTPETMLDSELIVPDTPGYESPDSTVVPETPRVKRRRRPVEEEEWFKEFLLILLPDMKDLL